MVVRRVRLMVLGIGLGLAVLAGSVAGCSQPAAAFEFTTPTEDAQRFLEWNREIVLTEAEDALMKEALTAMPAPCCSDRSAYTCCCPCNLAKSWWGLTKYLITEEAADVERIQSVVSEWFELVGPEKFSGDICYTGGCSRAWRNNGCGGMSEDTLAVE